jgi:hypothetical protein
LRHALAAVCADMANFLLIPWLKNYVARERLMSKWFPASLHVLASVACAVFSACGAPTAPPGYAVDFSSRSPLFGAGTFASPAATSAGTGAPVFTSAGTGASPTNQVTPPPSVAGTGGNLPVAGGTPAAIGGAGGRGSAGSGGAGGASMAMGGSGGAADNTVKATKLTLEFTTKAYGGKYTPINVGAVWVADMSGKWIYTLEMWCGWQNTRHLMPYTTAGGPDFSAGLFPGTYSGATPPTDVIATATLKTHQTHKGAAWSFKDSKGAIVPDGMYKLIFEFTEQEDAGKSLEVPFMKGGPAGPIMSAGNATYTDLRIALQ